MKKTVSTFFAFLCLCTLVFCIGISALDSVSSCTLYGKVLRLHVLANSDSPEDQNLKYKVRDGLLELTQQLFCECKDVNEAAAVARENKALLEHTAREILLQNGCDRDVQVIIGKENYPEKTYLDLTFPEGEYLSVRVLIGEGVGQNWWCVLFPPLCGVGTNDGGALLSSYGIDEGEVKKLKENSGGIEIFGCRIRFGILDYFT